MCAPAFVIDGRPQNDATLQPVALQVTLAAVRRPAPRDPVEQRITTYLTQCGRALPSVSRTFRSEDLLLQFAVKESATGATTFWMADLRGESLTTDQFSARIRSLRDNGTRHLILGIGPADGWSAQARAAAQCRLSLSAMTLPHELAALILAEQIYRVSTILQGHPYHLGH